MIDTFGASSVTIIVVSHKPYRIPPGQPYQPLLVGPTGSICDCSGWLRDDSGDHISERNPYYCELTGLYWAWKNLDAEVLGLCHYRRYLGSPDSLIHRIRKAKKDQILTGEQIEVLLRGYNVILPRKRHYWIETRESQYVHAHHFEDLRMTEEVLREKYPEYLPAWKQVLASRSGHICNMFIMRKALADEYCAWLFDILFEVERRLDISSYSERDQRVFGFLGERLLDVWVEKNELRYTEVPMVTLESQHWLKKGCAFLWRKIRGKY